MKIFWKIVGTVALICLVACLLVACDSDRDIPGNDSLDIVGDNSGDEPDTTESPPGDAWEDDGEAEADAGQTLDEFCGQYTGLWDCTVVEGNNVGFFVIILIETLDVLEHQHTLWFEYVQPTGLQFPFVCDGSSPATTGTGGSLYLSDDKSMLTIEAPHPVSPSMSRIFECTPHSTTD